MRKYLLTIVLIIPLLLIGCKKDPPAVITDPIKIIVRAMPSKTAISLQVESRSKGLILDVSNSFENKTYTTTQSVTPGDVIIIRYKLNMGIDQDNNGTASFDAYFKNNVIFAAGGAFGANWTSQELILK